MDSDDRICQLILDMVNRIDGKVDELRKDINGKFAAHDARVDALSDRVTHNETLLQTKEKARSQNLMVKLVFLTAGLGAFWWGVAEVIKRYVLK